MLKDRKLQPLQVPPPWYRGYDVRLLSHGSEIRIPCVLFIFYDFFKVVYSSFLLRLVLALRLLLGLR